MREINLDILKRGLPGITESMGTFFVEAAIVALSKNGHESGVVIELTGEFEENLRFVWSPIEKANIESWKNERKAAEYGAIALVILNNNDAIG